MNIPRIMIAAAGSGSGKTLLSCALMMLFSQEGKSVSAIKCGPDYIDPMFHRTVLGVPSRNLDTFFTGERLTKSLFARAAEGADLAVMEGVMGLYDGLGGIRKEGSSYHLAEVTKTPVILVVNAHGMGRSILPVIRGFLDYDRHHLIRGVILNQTSVTFCETIRLEIERELSLPVLGCLPKLKELHWDSRHLGLVMPEEIADVKKQIQMVADTLGKTLDCGKLLAIAASAEALETDPVPKKKIADVRIGIARDAAFGFYYEDNLQLLREAGAELVPFSPLQDESLPEGIAGLILGGGKRERQDASLLCADDAFFTGRKKRQCHQVRAGLYRSDVPSDGARRPFPESGYFFHWGETDEKPFCARGRGRRPCGNGGRDGTLRWPRWNPQGGIVLPSGRGNEDACDSGGQCAWNGTFHSAGHKGLSGL